jgi:hypothetical protein
MLAERRPHGNANNCDKGCDQAIFDRSDACSVFHKLGIKRTHWVSPLANCDDEDAIDIFKIR